jgi:hypothetical protein
MSLILFLLALGPLSYGTAAMGKCGMEASCHLGDLFGMIVVVPATGFGLLLSVAVGVAALLESRRALFWLVPSLVTVTVLLVELHKLSPHR